jgi:hypothetical protein
LYNGTHTIIDVTFTGKNGGSVSYKETSTPNSGGSTAPSVPIGTVNTTVIEGKKDPQTLGPFAGDTAIVYNGTHTIINVTANGKNGGSVTYKEQIPLDPVGTVNTTIIEGK